MASAKIFRINYKSDFILTLESDAGWMTPFCIKFWTGAPSQAYYVGWDGETYNHCSFDPSEPTKLQVQFDDHHLPIGDLKYQVAYHFNVADFPNDTEDEVINPASITTEIDGETYQVMLDFTGETAPEIQFALPAYANEAQRIANEQQRIAAETQRIANEETRIANEQTRINQEQTRQQNEQQRINQEQARVNEYATLKADAVAATDAANDAATLAQQKAEYAQQQGGYAKEQGDYAKNQGDYAKEQGDTALADHQRAEADHGIAVDDHTQAGNDHTRAESDHATAAADHTQAGQDHTTAASDHSRAESDHTTAAADHTQAGQDHTTAASDHGIAANDHTQAGNDHTRAESDHATAAADHTQAGNDHTRAESDHTRAESDHAAVEVYVDSLGAFDISAYHATGGVLAKYADLTAALGTNGANIPESIRKGGMSVKFVLTSDNKYLQYRYMGTAVTGNPNPFLDTTNWQGVDDEPKPESKNLVDSNGINTSIINTYINVDGFSILKYALTENGNFGSSTDFKHICVPVSAGEKYYIEVKNDDDDLRYAFVDSASASSSSAIPLVSGTTLQVVEGERYKDNIIIPEGCKYLLFSTNYSDAEDVYIVKKHPSAEIAPINRSIANVSFDNINKQHTLIRTFTPSGAATTISNHCTKDRTYYVILECTAQINFVTVGFGTNGTNVPVKMLDNGILFKGYNIFKAICDGSNKLIITSYTDVSNVYIYDAETSLSKDEKNLTSVEYRSGCEKESQIYKISSGSNINQNFLKIPVRCSGRIGLYLYDKESAFSSKLLTIYALKDGESSYTSITTSRNLLNSWLYLDLDYIINGIAVGSGASVTASSDTELILKIKTDGILQGEIDEVKESISDLQSTDATISEALNITNIVELPKTNITEGKEILNSGIVDNSKFNLYTFAIEDGKKYYIHAFLNGGLINNYLLCYSSDSAGANVLGVAYKGGSDPLYVPSLDSGKEYEQLKNIPEGANYFHVSVRVTEFATNYLKVAYSENDTMFNAQTNEERLSKLEGDIPDNASIFSLNPSSEYSMLMLKAKNRKYNRVAGNYDAYPISLLWFSDLHENPSNLQRIISWKETYNPYIDDIIATGDQQGLYFTDEFSWWDNSGAQNILQVIGNHDAWISKAMYQTGDYDNIVDYGYGPYDSETGLYSFYVIKQKEVYDKFFKDRISGWNVTQPTNAGTLGQNYYFKDYDNRLRLIVLDCKHYGSPDDTYEDGGETKYYQHEWFKAILEDARVNNLEVVVASHYYPRVITDTVCSWNYEYRGANGSDKLNTKATTAVTDFINDGGMFITWMVGHTHYDNVGLITSDNNQLVICNATANNLRSTAVPRPTCTKAQDSFNVISFNTSRGLINVVKVGCDMNGDYTRRRILSYQYKTFTDDLGVVHNKGLVQSY